MHHAQSLGEALCHPVEIRALSLQECARIQEFPDEWEFCGKVTEQYAQVGNAVPIRLGRVAGRLLAQELDSLFNVRCRRSPGEHPMSRLVYIRSHVRTRQWFKDGTQYVWSEGDDNSLVTYRPSKTQRREVTL